jgi:PAS domain S-box-containing protein
LSDDQGLVRRIKELEAEVSRLQGLAAIPYRAVIDDMSELIVRWKPDGTRLFVNNAYCRLFGASREELIGTTFWPLINEEDRQAVQARIAGLTVDSPVTTGNHRAIGPDGQVIWMEWVDRAIFDDRQQLVELQSVGRDITKRVQLEEDARRVARGDAAARATAAIAHDLRNVLQVMSGVTAVLERGQIESQDISDLHGAMRAARDLLTRLDDVSHGRVMQPVDVDLSDRVEKLSGLLSAMVGARIKIERRIHEEPCRIKGDPTQIDQILLNLVRNSWDAMPQGGNIVIETEVATRPRLATARWPADVGRFAVLRVSDDGAGISAEILPRVFDARITTKPNGQGLGLATVKAIVDGHDGVVTVESSPAGTTFELAFPLVVPEL